MPKVRFLKSVMGTFDCQHIGDFKQGDIATIPDELYRYFNEMGLVERVNAKPTTTIENKAIQGAPENKITVKAIDEGEENAI